jgi:hypothetical protein
VTDPPAPAERPAYWATCESKDLVRLGFFIHDALKRLTEPKVPTDGSTPISRQEFLDLVGQMQARADSQKEDATVPARPVYDGPPAPPLFYSSNQLEEARAKRNRTLDRLEAAIRYRQSESFIQHRRNQFDKAEQELAAIDREERRRWEERRREYEQARAPYERSLSAWKQEAARAKRNREANDKRQALVDRARGKVEAAFKPKHRPKTHGPTALDFEIAGPGEQSDEHIRRYFGEVLRSGQLKGFSQDRLDKMLALPRSNWKKGKAGFYGYIVLLFDHTEKVLLECPVEGNAIYVLDSDSERLLEMRKPDLIASSEAKRIFHSGNDWYRRLKDELGIE